MKWHTGTEHASRQGWSQHLNNGWSLCPWTRAAGWRAVITMFIFITSSAHCTAPHIMHKMYYSVLHQTWAEPQQKLQAASLAPAIWRDWKYYHCGQQSLFVAVYGGEDALLSLAVLIWRAGRHRPQLGVQLGSEVPKLSASIQLPSHYVSPGPVEPGRGNIILVSVTDCAWSYQSPEVNLSWCTALNIHYYTLKASGCYGLSTEVGKSGISQIIQLLDNITILSSTIFLLIQRFESPTLHAILY